MDITVVRKNIKNANIKVKECGTVILSVPNWMRQRHIDDILTKQSAWINRKIAQLKSRPIKVSKQYISGEKFAFLGKDLSLEVIANASPSVVLHGDKLQLRLDSLDDFASKKELITKWYFRQAEHHYTQAINKYSPHIAKPINRVTIKKMRSRWGSCNHAKGYINLNSELVKTPPECIEYVVMHELVHLVHPNHSKDFYAVLHHHFPNWQHLKNLLKNFSLTDS